MKISASERFDRHVTFSDPTPGSDGASHIGFAVWIAGKHKQGYGLFKLHGKTVKAHRFALERSLGRQLLPGLQALHTCDYTSCVDARHLWEGTNIDNVDDRTRKDRSPRGERHRATMKRVAARGESSGQSVLTEAIVRECRRRHAADPNKDTYTRLGKEFGVTYIGMRSAIIGLNWKHLT